MSRSRHSRVLTVVLTLWMSLFMSESEWIVRCATHGGGVASAVTDSHAPAASHDVAMAGHDHGDKHSAPNGDSSHRCSCPGPGCCPPAVAAVSDDALPPAHIVAVHEATAVSALDLFSEASDYLHPPATAPPAVALALSA